MSVSSTYSITEEDTVWLKNLQRTAPGRQLDDHFKCVDFVIQNKNRTECPVQQVAMFRRVFCRAFAENDRCFGLPRPTPKFVAIVNLSGYRTILYSNRATLIRLLTMVGPEASQRVMTNVEQVLNHANTHGTSILFCFSLPWQAGVHQVYWEARTLERRADGSVRDGAKSYAYTHEEVRTCAPTGDTDIGDHVQMHVQMDAMAKHYAACNVDIVVDDEASISEGDSERMQRLMDVMATVKADRTRLLGEIKALKDEQTASIIELTRVSDERVAKVIQSSQNCADVAEKKIKELQAKVTALTEENSVLTKARAEADRSKVEQDLLFGNEKSSLQSRAKLQEMSAKSATEKLAALQKSSTREREGLQKAHAIQLEDLERRLSDKTLECRKLHQAVEERSSANVRLDDVIERMRIEKQALQYETINRRKKVIGLQCALAVACNEHSKCMAAAAIAKDGMEAGQSELQQMLGKAEGAAHTSEKALELMSIEMDELKKELEAERKKKRPKSPPAPPSPPPKPETVDFAGQTAPMKSKVDDELEKLSERFVKLEDEKTAWTAREAALMQQVTELQAQLQTVAITPVSPPNSMPPSPPNETQIKQQVYNNVYNHVVVPTNNNNAATGWQQGPIDLGTDPHGDAGMEALVGQVQLSLRALVDMARQGTQHKQAADNMWSELQALKRFTGADGGGWAGAPGYYGEVVPMQPPLPQQWVPSPQSVQYSNGHGAMPRSVKRR